MHCREVSRFSLWPQMAPTRRSIKRQASILSRSFFVYPFHSLSAHQFYQTNKTPDNGRTWNGRKLLVVVVWRQPLLGESTGAIDSGHNQFAETKDRRSR